MMLVLIDSKRNDFVLSSVHPGSTMFLAHQRTMRPWQHLNRVPTFTLSTNQPYPPKLGQQCMCGLPKSFSASTRTLIQFVVGGEKALKLTLTPRKAWRRRRRAGKCQKAKTQKGGMHGSLEALVGQGTPFAKETNSIAACYNVSSIVDSKNVCANTSKHLVTTFQLSH